MKIRIEIDLTASWNKFYGFLQRFRIGHFLLLYFSIHMLRIAFPSDGSMIFDEAHYVPASLKTLQWEPANAEHSPLAKIIAAIGMWVLGNNWFGWRFPQVLMQIGVLYLFFLLARRLLGDPWALGVTMLLGFDPVFFIHGGALLIDMPSSLFGLLAMELYFRRRYSWSAASMGLAFLAREMSIFYLVTLGVYHLVGNRRAPKAAVKLGFRCALIALLVFGPLLWFYDVKFQMYSSISAANLLNQNVVIGPDGTAITTITSTSQLISKELILKPIQNILFIYGYHGPQGMIIKEPFRAYQYAWNWILPVHVSPNVRVTLDPLDSSHTSTLMSMYRRLPAPRTTFRSGIGRLQILSYGTLCGWK